MPRLPSEGLARLSYRPGSRGSRLSLFHVKLTDEALQALLAHRRLQYLRIPRTPADRPGPRSPLFTFYLTRCSKEKPQASFDCVRQSASRLEGEGVILERLTFCATTEAPACRLPQPHLERQPWSSVPPAVSQEKGSSLPAKPGPATTVHSAGGASRKGPAGRELQALGPFLAELLALRPHQKADFLQRADWTRLGLQARLQVLAALKEVGQLDPPEGSSSQEEELLGQGQEDGSGQAPREPPQRPPLHLHREPLSLDRQGKELQAEPLLSAGADEHSCGSPQAETPDYCLKYGPISSAQQCQAYKEAFGTDYTEYRHLHARIASVSRRFAQLGASIRMMQRGTEHYKVLENQILQEYRQFKKVYPNYQKEKQHCEYLHKKLSHIKEQILNFEQSLPAAQAGSR
ncbi:hypothetical protein lerEdw1_011019 [Lerista edwardsae]|nr:hypothetical protein lerEdw1_011019 [Lerista edwardsae]